MSRGRKVGVAVLVLVGVLIAGVAWYLGPIAPIATGYAAKTVCSGVFISDRAAEDVEQDLPPNPLVPLLRTAVDFSEGSARTSLAGAWASTAYHSTYGCTLAEERPDFAPAGSPAERDPGAPWPVGDRPPSLPDGIDQATLDAAIATAFTEDDPEGRPRNTRAVVVIKDGELIAERYGHGFGADTPLLGWSMAKSVANAMVGRLVGAGDLRIDETGLRDDWADDDRSEITVEHLLTMSSGLAFEEVYDPGTDATEMLFTRAVRPASPPTRRSRRRQGPDGRTRRGPPTSCATWPRTPPVPGRSWPTSWCSTPSG